MCHRFACEVQSLEVAAVDFESDCDLVVVFENERADDQQINDLRSELESIRAKEFRLPRKSTCALKFADRWTPSNCLR